MRGVDLESVSPWVKITSYSVEFRLNTGHVGPSLPSATYDETVSIDVGGTTTFTANMVTDDMKSTLIGAEWTDGTYTFPVYTVKYTFYGKDIDDNNLTASAVKTITLGDFDNCAG